MVTAESGVWLYEYDYLGNIKSVKNPNESGNSKALGTRYEYDENHHRTKTTFSDGSIMIEKRDIAGNLISRTLPELVENGQDGYHYEYGGENRLKEIRNPLGEVEKRFVYDQLGNLVKEISAKGYLTASDDEARIGTLREYDLMDTSGHAQPVGGEHHPRYPLRPDGIHSGVPVPERAAGRIRGRRRPARPRGIPRRARRAGARRIRQGRHDDGRQHFRKHQM